MDAPLPFVDAMGDALGQTCSAVLAGIDGRSCSWRNAVEVGVIAGRCIADACAYWKEYGVSWSCCTWPACVCSGSFDCHPTHTPILRGCCGCWDVPEWCKQGRHIGTEGQLHICIELLGEEVGVVHGLVWIRLPARPASTTSVRANMVRFLSSDLTGTAGRQPLEATGLCTRQPRPGSLQPLMTCKVACTCPRQWPHQQHARDCCTARLRIAGLEAPAHQMPADLLVHSSRHAQELPVHAPAPPETHGLPAHACPSPSLS